MGKSQMFERSGIDLPILTCTIEPEGAAIPAFAFFLLFPSGSKEKVSGRRATPDLRTSLGRTECHQAQ